jgi:hypothetical protein
LQWVKYIYFEEETRINTIKMNSFVNCSNLESIILPSTIKTIGSGVFAFCTKLKTIYAEFAESAVANFSELWNVIDIDYEMMDQDSDGSLSSQYYKYANVVYR